MADDLTMDVLHVQQASMQFSDTPSQVERDLNKIYGRNAHVIGFTEASDFHPVLSDLAKDHHYRLIQPRRGRGGFISTPIAVRRDLVTKAYGWHFTTPGKPGKPSEGGHGPRGTTWVTLDFYGSKVTVHEAHLLTGWYKGGQLNDRGRAILRQWRATLNEARRDSQGYDIAVVMGDVNYDPDDPTPDTPSHLLKKYGFTSVFEEIGRPDWPTHGHRTIDQIYIADRDRRVGVKEVKVWSDSVQHTFTDHSQVSAWLEITRRRDRRAK